jgi:preprotein translocase subunit SecG
MELQQIIIIVHVLIALSIIGLVLLQQGKGADMGASFGSGSSQTVFGGVGGGSVLTKATAILATAFFATSFGLAIVAKNLADDSLALELESAVLVEDAIPMEEAEVLQDDADSEIPGAEFEQDAETDIPGAGE